MNESGPAGCKTYHYYGKAREKPGSSDSAAATKAGGKIYHYYGKGQKPEGSYYETITEDLRRKTIIVTSEPTNKEKKKQKKPKDLNPNNSCCESVGRAAKFVSAIGCLLFICLLVVVVILFFKFPEHSTESEIDWRGENWARGCDFPQDPNYLTQKSASREECRNACISEDDCTHFVWQNDLCSLKGGNVVREMAVRTEEEEEMSVACGIIRPGVIINDGCEDLGTSTTEGCVFPFTFNGVQYNGCTIVDETRSWCSTKVDVSGIHVKGNWKYCNCPADACPKYWHPLANKCIYSNNEHLNFVDAKARCKALGGRLLEPRNEMEQKLWRASQEGSKSFSWIGVKIRSYQNKTCEYASDDIIVTKTFFADGEPDSGEGFCIAADVSHSGGGLWHDRQCFNTLPFTCEREMKGNPCGKEGWTGLYDKCILEQEDTFIGFYEAADFCKQNGGKLTEPRGMRQQALLVAFLGLTYSSWIGVVVRDHHIERYEFISNSEQVRKSFFQPGEPNSNGAEKCVAMYYGKVMYNWNDASCTLAATFSCEMDIPIFH